MSADKTDPTLPPDLDIPIKSEVIHASRPMLLIGAPMEERVGIGIINPRGLRALMGGTKRVVVKRFDEEP